jgi:hypothetical protein
MSKEVRLIATKDINGIQARLADTGYRTRRLKAGDEFFVSEVMAGLMVNGLKKATRTRPTANVPPPPAALRSRLSQLDHDGNGKPGGSAGAADHMRALREEYTRVVGKRPFSGWDEATLREKMAAAQKG